MEFRERLWGTIRALRPLLGEGVLVVGSEVPNLAPADPPLPVVVSKDIDLGVEVRSHGRVKAALPLLTAFRPSPGEPSVLSPTADPDLLEVNFVGIDARLRDLSESYVLEDPTLPLLVFGRLSLVLPGVETATPGGAVRIADRAGLAVEKLLSERSGVKGERDLLVALALLLGMGEGDERRLHDLYGSLDAEERYQIRSNLTLLSLLAPHAGMPDPVPHRALVGRVLRRMEEEDGRA